MSFSHDRFPDKSATLCVGQTPVRAWRCEFRVAPYRPAGTVLPWQKDGRLGTISQMALEPMHVQFNVCSMHVSLVVIQTSLILTFPVHVVLSSVYLSALLLRTRRGRTRLALLHL